MKTTVHLPSGPVEVRPVSLEADPEKAKREALWKTRQRTIRPLSPSAVVSSMETRPTNLVYAMERAGVIPADPTKPRPFIG